MTALDNTPYNKNFLNPLNFNFYIKRAPHVNFFVQSVNLPGFGFVTPLQQTPFTNIPQTGDRITFQDLEVTFKVDEELQNYLEIANWIRAIGFPEGFEQYAGIKANRPGSGEEITSDITLIISNAIKVPQFQIDFRNAFPINLGRINFQTTDQTVNYASCTATFKYILFDINMIA